MARLKIYDPSIPKGQILAEREVFYIAKSPKEKLSHLFSLINISVTLNHGKPLKTPQGKGMVFSRKKIFTFEKK